MSKNIVSIVGATGIQGSSVVDALLKDDSYSLRAITRDPDREKAKALATSDIEVVKADLNNLDSLKAAFSGSYAIFAVTDFFEPFGQHGAQKAMEIEE